jgi:predicted nucleic-acid-binding protein
VIAVDTNVIVRLVANDDPAQSPRAARLFAREDVYVPKTVVLETEWVLRVAYELTPDVRRAKKAGAPPVTLL